jgi:DnaJ-class molecular chaperone
MEQTHYYVLGINKRADLNKIKRAYRVAARKYHPDLTGSDSEMFHRVQEAYDTLSDRDKKRAYDLRHNDTSESGPSVRANPVTERQRYEYQESPSARPGPAGMSWDADQFFSYTDELLKGFAPGFFDRHIDREKDFYVDLILSPTEAAEGGYMPMQMPVMVECPQCGTSRFFGRCSLCHGYGRVETTHSFFLFVPPGTHGGMEEILHLDDIGLRGSRLHVSVVVSRS